MTGWRKNYQDSDPWQSISQSQWIQRPDCKLMTSLRFHLFPKLIFPLALSAAERLKLDRALAERHLSSRLREQTLHLYPYLCANIHTHRQASKHMCVQTQFKRWEVELSLTPTGPAAWECFKLHSLVCSAAYSCLFCMFLSHGCLCCKCVLIRWECAGMFLFSWHECLFWGIPVFGLYTSRVDTLSDTAYQFLNQVAVHQNKCVLLGVYTSLHG